MSSVLPLRRSPLIRLGTCRTPIYHIILYYSGRVADRESFAPIKRAVKYVKLRSGQGAVVVQEEGSTVQLETEVSRINTAWCVSPVFFEFANGYKMHSAQRGDVFRLSLNLRFGLSCTFLRIPPTEP